MLFKLVLLSIIVFISTPGYYSTLRKKVDPFPKPCNNFFWQPIELFTNRIIKYNFNRLLLSTLRFDGLTSSSVHVRLFNGSSIEGPLISTCIIIAIDSYADVFEEQKRI